MNLNKKVEIRITETEKEIVDALRNKNINLSEEIRDFILCLDINLSRKLLKSKYKQNNNRMTEIEIQLIKLNGEYKILKKKNLNPKELDNKNSIKLKMKDLLNEHKQLDRFFEKYSLIFPKNKNLFDNF